MRKSLAFLIAGLVVLLFAPAGWSQSLDPRENPGDCGFTSIEETWTPDLATGILTKRVTWEVECGGLSPAANVTITTEEWNGASLEVTEVRQAVRSLYEGTYTTDYEIYDGSMNLLGKEVHRYNLGIDDPNLWLQDWTYYDWDGSQYQLTGFTSRVYTGLLQQQGQVLWIYKDTTFRQDPVIPPTVPVLGSGTSYSSVPPEFRKLDPSTMSETEQMLYRRLLQLFEVNVNTGLEGNQWLRHYQPDFSCSYSLSPPGTYILAVLMGDRFNDEDPISGDPFSGFFSRYVRWSNDVGGNLNALFGWTSDRDLNEPSNNWWQARVRQSADGSIEAIENAHRVGETQTDHADTITTLSGGFQIVEQQYKQFNWVEPTGDFSELNTVVDGNQSPLRQVLWTVAWD